MRRDVWLAALQAMPWVPCAESNGLPRYRAVEAYHCTYCAYTVCASCYNAIPTGLLISARDSSSTGRGSIGQKQQQQSNTNDDEEFCRPQCFLCRRGVLVRESAPVHEWTCEGPRPARRLQRGVDASYDMDVVQRYYTMKEQREKRVLSQAPLVAHFHGADPPHVHFASNSNNSGSSSSSHNTNNDINNKNGTPLDIFGSGATCRRPACEEGSSFVFSVENPRMQQSCVWCAVNRQLRDNHPSLLGDATISPLQTFWCPPSLPGIPPRLFRVEVPYGVYGLHNVHALALYLTDDIFRKATTKLQMSHEQVTTMAEPAEKQKQSLRGHLTAGKVLPRDVVRPLLVVDILHRVASSEPLRELLDVRWFVARALKEGRKVVSPMMKSPRSAITKGHCDINKSNEESEEVIKNEGDGNVEAMTSQRQDFATRATVPIPECNEEEKEEEEEENKGVDYVSTSWPDGLRCDELLLTVDHILHGRSVAVYGIGSKYFFLQHVSQSAELRYHGVVVVDGYRATSHQVVRQLRDVRKHLSDQQQRAERELLRNLFQHSSHCEPYELHGRSGAPARETQQEQPSEQEQEQNYYHSVDSSPPESPRSQSYRTPMRSLARHDGSSQTRRRCADEKNTNVDVDFNTLKSSRLTTPPPPTLSSSQEIMGGAVPLYSPAPHAGQREDSIMLVQGDSQEMGIRASVPLNPPNKQQQQKQEQQIGNTDGMCLTERITHSDEKGRTWSRWHWLREHSNWNFDVPFRSTRNNNNNNKRPREEEEKETDEETAKHNQQEQQQQEKEEELPLHERGPRVPRFVVSPEILKSLRLACRAPLRSCISWMSLPSLTAHRLIAGKFPSLATCITPTLRSGYSNTTNTTNTTNTNTGTTVGRQTLLIVHGVDQLDAPLLLELQSIAREYPYRVILLCSFDDPNWPTSNSAALLDPFRMAYVHLRSLLLPRVHEMSGINSLTLLTEMEASAAGGGRFGYYSNRNRANGSGFGAGASLPLHDTIRRILFSLPSTFSELLRCMIAKQESAGEGVFVPISLHQQHFDECGLMVSMGRLKAIERELTSNRLAIFNAAENKLLIPQHRKLLKVLEEVDAQRRGSNTTSGGTGVGASAPVEA